VFDGAAVVPRFFCGQDGVHLGQRVTPLAIGPCRLPIAEHHLLHHAVSVINLRGTISTLWRVLYVIARY
jgi:hypothetical protein